jgi:tetratricopeptide (TPR) repeat protein
MPVPKSDKSLLTAIEKERLADVNLDPIIRKRNDMIVRNKIITWLKGSDDILFALHHMRVRKLKKELDDEPIYRLLWIVRELLDLRDFGSLWMIGKETIVVKPFVEHHNLNFPPNPSPQPAKEEDFRRIFSLEIAIEEINVLLPKLGENPAYENFKDQMLDILSEIDVWNRRGVEYISSAQHLKESEDNEKSKLYLERAIKCFDKTLKADLKNVEAWFNKAVALDKLSQIKKGYDSDNLGRIKGAIQCYDRVVDLEPTNLHAWFRRGFLFFDLAGNDDEITPDTAIEESIRSFDKVLELDSSDKLASNLKIEAENFREELKKHP